jgi:hypothetical protein
VVTARARQRDHRGQDRKQRQQDDEPAVTGPKEGTAARS